MRSGDILISIQNLEKSYNGVKVLKGINLNIEKGSKYGLIGRSGTGKSTLLRCINGLEDYDSGSLKVKGVEVKDLSKNELRVLRKDIGMIFQNFSLLNRLDVYDNIALPLRCWNYDNDDIDNKVRELLELVELPNKIHSKPNELSGGQKQRVAIARALSLNSEILLCDEATSALDRKTSQSTIELLDNINKNLGITLVVVTHQMSVLRSICDEISILEDGIVASQGKVEEIFREKPQALKNLMGNSDLLIPENGCTLEIYFTKESGNIPVVSRLSRDLNIDCLVLAGDMEVYGEDQLESITINIEDANYLSVSKYLDKENLIWKRVG